MQFFLRFLQTKVLVFLVIFSSGVASYAQPSFNCSGLVYQVAASDARGNVSLYAFNINTGLRKEIKALGRPINAIGYNSTDNMIWGYDQGVTPSGEYTNQIVRIDSLGNMTSFSIPNLPADIYNTADFIGDGYLVFYRTDTGTSTRSYYMVDLKSTRSTYLKLVDPLITGYPEKTGPSFATTMSALTFTNDMAFNPTTGNLVGLGTGASNQGKIVRLNPNTGDVTVNDSRVTGDGLELVTGAFGATFIDAGSPNFLYVFSNTTGRFYRINLTTNTATLLSSASSALNNDGASCPSAIISYPISGNVYNDVNGMTDNTVGGTGTNAGALFAVLYDNTTGKVGAVETVGANGAYNFGSTPGNTYTIYLTTATATVGQTAVPLVALPAGWVHTGERLGTAAGNDGLTNGIISVGAVNAPVTNANFGIQQAPQTTTSILPGQPNPGGANAVSIPSNSFSVGTGGNPNTADPSTGVVSFIKITTFPSNATSVIIDGNIFTNLADINTAYPNGIPTNASGVPTVDVGIDPIDGVANVTLLIAAVDNAGAQDPTPGSITVPFTISVSGNVWNDANGSASKEEAEPFTNAGGLYANLVSASGTVTASVAVDPLTGAYSFAGASPATSYSVILTETIQSLNTSLTASDIPDGWVNTGVNYEGTANTGNKSGVLALTTAFSDITNVNFGIEQAPESDTQNYVLALLPVSGQFIPLDGSIDNAQPLTGRDAEDMPTRGNMSGKSIRIESLPINGELYYAGTLVTTGLVIENLDPSQLQIKLTGSGYSTTSFSWSHIDAAGQADVTPGTYTLSWGGALPVRLVGFELTREDKTSSLKWITSEETQSSYFGIERSADGKTWTEIGQVKSGGQGQALRTYSFQDVSPMTGENLYRLRMVDLDGSFALSRILSASFEIAMDTYIYPNPTRERIQIQANGYDLSKVRQVAVYDLTGRIVNRVTSLSAEGLDVSVLPDGVYFIKITLESGVVQNVKFVKSK